MRLAFVILLSVFSPLSLSQQTPIDIKKSYLSSFARIGASEVASNKRLLNKSLSQSLMQKVVRSSEPYAITNMAEIQALIDSEKNKLYPDLRVSLNIFPESEKLNIVIDRIDTRYERTILRGKVEGKDESQVKLVVYQGQMTGRISLSAKPRVYVIRSVNGGFTANYEVDTSDIRYH